MLSNGFWSHLRRYPHSGYVGGVCAGLGAYYDFNVKIIRALLVIAVLCGWGLPIIAYLIFWYLMEPDPGIPADGPSGGTRPHANGTRPASSAELRARFARMEERLRNMETCVSSSEYELRRELRKLEA